jgi:hypothetical protein
MQLMVAQRIDGETCAGTRFEPIDTPGAGVKPLAVKNKHNNAVPRLISGSSATYMVDFLADPSWALHRAQSAVSSRQIVENRLYGWFRDREIVLLVESHAILSLVQS